MPGDREPNEVANVHCSARQKGRFIAKAGCAEHYCSFGTASLSPLLARADAVHESPQERDGDRPYDASPKGRTR